MKYEIHSLNVYKTGELKGYADGHIIIDGDRAYEYLFRLYDLRNGDSNTLVTIDYGGENPLVAEMWSEIEQGINSEIMQREGITFEERKPFVSDAMFLLTRQTLIPVYMIKDGVEYFVCNRSIAGGNHSPEYHRKKVEGYKAQILLNGGRYFKFNGQYDAPEEMLKEMSKRGHTFVKKDDLFLASPDGHYGAGHVSFWGNRNEVSAAFHYRIFDREYAAMLQAQAKPIVENGKKLKRK